MDAEDRSRQYPYASFEASKNVQLPKRVPRRTVSQVSVAQQQADLDFQKDWMRKRGVTSSVCGLLGWGAFAGAFFFADSLAFWLFLIIVFCVICIITSVMAIGVEWKVSGGTNRHLLWAGLGLGAAIPLVICLAIVGIVVGHYL